MRKIYLADSGRLPLIVKQGRTIFYKPAGRKDRKTTGTAVLARSSGELISINSHRANDVVFQGMKNDEFPELIPWNIEQREYSWQNSRFDFLLEKSGEKLLLEVKSVTLVQNSTAYFPDAPTERGRRHVRELIEWSSENNKKGMILFLLGRNDADIFTPCKEIDPDFASVLSRAARENVKILAYRSRINLRHIRPGNRIKIALEN